MEGHSEYRVVVDTWQDIFGDKTYTIRLVEYDTEGKIKRYSTDGHDPWGRSLGEIVDDFDLMAEAFMKPVLMEDLGLGTLVPMEEEDETDD